MLQVWQVCNHLRVTLKYHADSGIVHGLLHRNGLERVEYIEFYDEVMLLRYCLASQESYDIADDHLRLFEYRIQQGIVAELRVVHIHVVIAWIHKATSHEHPSGVYQNSWVGDDEPLGFRVFCSLVQHQFVVPIGLEVLLYVSV